MAVHFMFAASKEFESVPVEGESIALGQLKDEIFNLKFRAAMEKRSVKERFDFRVFDAESKQEILGAGTRVPRHSRVVVKRLPAYVVFEAEKQQQQQAVQQITNPNPKPCPIDDDGFGGDVLSTASPPKQPVASPPKQPAKKQPAKKQPAPTCVRSDRLSNSERSESSANSLTGLSSSETTVVRVIPPDLACSVCHDIMKDAVLIPCCFTSFCRSCVTAALSLHHRCPNCASSKCKPSDVLPNRSLGASISLHLKTNGTLTSSSSAKSGLSSEHMMSESINVTVQPHLTTTSSYCAAGEKRKLAPLSTSLANAKRTKPLIISLANKAKAVS